MSERSRRASIGVPVVSLAVMVGVGVFCLLSSLSPGGAPAIGPAVVGAQETTTTDTPTTTTEPPTTTTEEPPTTTETPPTTESPPTTQRSTTTTGGSSTTTSSTTSTTSSTTTTVAPVQITPPAAPPTEEVNAGGGGGGLSSDAKLGIVVGGLAAVAAFIGLLTFLYWRRTRPAPYGTALDALADITLVPAATATGATLAAEGATTVGPVAVLPADGRGQVEPNPDDGAGANGGLLFPPRTTGDNPALDLSGTSLFPPRTGEHPQVPEPPAPPAVKLPEPPPPIVTLEDIQGADGAPGAERPPGRGEEGRG